MISARTNGGHRVIGRVAIGGAIALAAAGCGAVAHGVAIIPGAGQPAAHTAPTAPSPSISAKATAVLLPASGPAAPALPLTSHSPAAVTNVRVATPLVTPAVSHKPAPAPTVVSESPSANASTAVPPDQPPPETAQPPVAP